MLLLRKVSQKSVGFLKVAHASFGTALLRCSAARRLRGRRFFEFAGRATLSSDPSNASTTLDNPKASSNSTQRAAPGGRQSIRPPEPPPETDRIWSKA